MKRLMVVVAVALASVMAIGAQCEGKTLAGERCKREAAEGSKFCIGHADQAKKPDVKKPDAKDPDAKEKDDGQCWAVTDAGTRCKHKKDGESDYCKQHGPDTKAKKPGGQCRALKWDGARCTRAADGEYIYCKQHRKQPTSATKVAEEAPAAKKASRKKAAAEASTDEAPAAKKKSRKKATKE